MELVHLLEETTKYQEDTIILAATILFLDFKHQLLDCMLMQSIGHSIQMEFLLDVRQLLLLIMLCCWWEYQMELG